MQHYAMISMTGLWVAVELLGIMPVSFAVSDEAAGPDVTSLP